MQLTKQECSSVFSLSGCVSFPLPFSVFFNPPSLNQPNGKAANRDAHFFDALDTPKHARLTAHASSRWTPNRGNIYHMCIYVYFHGAPAFSHRHRKHHQPKAFPPSYTPSFLRCFLPIPCNTTWSDKQLPPRHFMIAHFSIPPTSVLLHPFPLLFELFFCCLSVFVPANNFSCLHTGQMFVDLLIIFFTGQTSANKKKWLPSPPFVFINSYVYSHRPYRNGNLWNTTTVYLNIVSWMCLSHSA